MKTDDFSPLREVTGDVTEANVNISAVKRFIGFTIGFHNHREGPTMTFSWLKAPTSAFTFKTILRHYATQALTPQ